MYETLLPAAIFVGLFFLCLPLEALRRGVLAVAGWGLRLALVAAISSSAYFFYRPQGMPPEMKSMVADLGAALGIASAPWSIVAAIGLLTAGVLPLISLMDAARLGSSNASSPRRAGGEENAEGAKANDATIKTHGPAPGIRPAHKTQAAITSMSGDKKKRLGELVE